MALPSGITPGNVQSSIWDSRDQSQVSQVQGKKKITYFMYSLQPHNAILNGHMSTY